jgi:hypothetical protein
VFKKPAVAGPYLEATNFNIILHMWIKNANKKDKMKKKRMPKHHYKEFHYM